jgi:DNA ligase (NAD+)
VSFFQEEHNTKALDDLAHELTIQDIVSSIADQQSPLFGKSVVFTGTLEKMGRAEAKAKAEAIGAHVSSAVSAKTNYVVVGTDAGSKATKAKELGVTVITEDEWLELIQPSL